MKKIIKLTESDLSRIVRRVIKEQTKTIDISGCLSSISNPPQSCKNNDGGNCIKELGRLIYNSNPEISASYGSAVSCISTKMKS